MRGGPPAWGLGEVLTTPPCENPCYEILTRRDASSGDKIIRRYTTPPLGSPGEGGLFLEEAPRGR